QVAQRTLGVDGPKLEVVALANKRRVDLQATHEGPAPFIVRATRGLKVRENIVKGNASTSKGVKVERIDLMQSTGDLGGAPSLVNAQIGYDIRNVPTPVTLGCAADGAEVDGIYSACVGDDTHTRETDRNEIGISQRASSRIGACAVKTALAD